MRRLALVGLVACVTLTGCCQWRERKGGLLAPGPGWSAPPPVPGGYPAPPPGSNPEILTPTPGPTEGVPPLRPPSSSGFGPLPPDLLPPTNVPLDQRNYGAAAAPPAIARRFETAEPPLAPPAPVAPPAQPPRASDAPAATRALPPDLIDPREIGRIPMPPADEGPAAPASPIPPVGIPLFAEVKDRLATGLRPDPEGLDWLKSNGYQTVVHVHRPGTPTPADREQVEKRGLKYLPLELSPATLTRKRVDEFNALVADYSNRPLFVYDKDGTLAGALWYLHFRTAELAAPEAARVKARRFGLKDESTGEHAELWIAIQKLQLP